MAVSSVWTVEQLSDAQNDLVEWGSTTANPPRRIFINRAVSRADFSESEAVDVLSNRVGEHKCQQDVTMEWMSIWLLGLDAFYVDCENVRHRMFCRLL